MIFMDPPYGIKFGRVQPEIGKSDVKDKDSDLTREPEMVKAYRDTWQLGVHFYLSYLRQRIIAARELLHDSGSLFVQIGDENLHRVRCLLDEVFSPDCFIANITFRTTSNQSSGKLGVNSDYLIWYARNPEKLKYRQLHLPYTLADDIGSILARPNWTRTSPVHERPRTRKHSADTERGQSLSPRKPSVRRSYYYYSFPLFLRAANFTRVRRDTGRLHWKD